MATMLAAAPGLAQQAAPPKPSAPAAQVTPPSTPAPEQGKEKQAFDIGVEACI